MKSYIFTSSLLLSGLAGLLEHEGEAALEDTSPDSDSFCITLTVSSLEE